MCCKTSVNNGDETKKLSHYWFGRVTSHYLSWALLSTSQKYPGTDNCGQIEQKFSGIPVKARKTMIYISEGFTFSAKHSAWMNCSMSLKSPRNYRFCFFFSVQMVRALSLRMTCKDLPVWPLTRHEVNQNANLYLLAFEIYILWPPSWFQLCNISMAMFTHRNSNKKKML